MPQKVLAGRTADPSLQEEIVQVKVDQVILTRAPARALAEAQLLGLKKTPVEVAVAYEGVCVSDAQSVGAKADQHRWAVAPETLSHCVLIARPGVGFPAPVHLERFASPARLAVTDDPRMCFVGGIGMLAMVVPPGQLGQALAQGSVMLRPPRSVQVLLSGRIRPFVCARDVALELLRRGITEIVQRIDAEYGAPVVIEFAGPSARLLSVAERAVLCAIAPAAGAASALFVSDEKSEVFLRDQRRSKAHRSLAPDPGAPCDEVLSIDLATVDPLLRDEKGEIKSVRDLAGQPVHQVVLGGDSGTTLRDMLAAATLLKSKRVPPRLDLLVAPQSRQVLEILAQTGALLDLVATGARILEPDYRIITGEIYPPGPGQVSLRTFDPSPNAATNAPFIVASAETLAYSVATGTIGDPRSFKRPVRVTVPRVFPTEDVLIVRPRKSDGATTKKSTAPEPIEAVGWKQTTTLQVHAAAGAPPAQGSMARAVVLSTAEEVRKATSDAIRLASTTRALIAPFIPSATATVLNGLGVAPLRVEAKWLEALSKAGQISIPVPSEWAEDNTFQVQAGESVVPLKWLGRADEKKWLQAGTARPPAPPPKAARQQV